MVTTGLLVRTVIVLCVLAGPAWAQTQPPTPAPTPPAATRPLDRTDLRHHIYIMEGALARAVEFGAQRLNREIRSVVPEMVVLAGEAQARGVYLDGYGVFFDVGVPVLRQSMVWSLRMMLDQDDKGLRDSIAALRGLVKKSSDPAERNLIENVIARLEAQLGPSATAAGRPGAAMTAAQSGGAVAVPPIVADAKPPVAESEPAPGAAETPKPGSPRNEAFDRMFLKDPNAAYTDSVQRALIDAMIDYSAPIMLGPDEWLTVAARDNEPRDSLAPADPYNEVVTIVLRIKGSDLAEYRAGRIDGAEARRRVQVREF